MIRRLLRLLNGWVGQSEHKVNQILDLLAALPLEMWQDFNRDDSLSLKDRSVSITITNHFNRKWASLQYKNAHINLTMTQQHRLLKIVNNINTNRLYAQLNDSLTAHVTKVFDQKGESCQTTTR